MYNTYVSMLKYKLRTYPVHTYISYVHIVCTYVYYVTYIRMCLRMHVCMCWQKWPVF